MDCDLSLYDTATAMLTYDATWHLNDVWEPDRLARSAHPSLVPFQLFQGDDGRWFVVACAKEKFWRRLTDTLGMPELAHDARFEDFPARYRHRAELVALLDRAFCTRPASHWVKALGDAGVPVGPVQSVTETLADDHTRDRELIVESPHESLGTLRTLRSPARVGAEPARLGRAPQRNEHAAAIFDELGYTEAQRESFTIAGAFG
jgi:crotonobetainyl-CoA:carnitine CoA-transferase CaiB-like acyl-CoA transferase